MSTFGDIERTFADLYEYRWAIGGGVLVILAAAAALGYGKGWHLAIWRRRLPVALISTPFLVLTLWLGWSLGSPLFTNVTVIEEVPFSRSAIGPGGMEQADVEGVMAGMAKVGDTVVQAMPGAAAISMGSAMMESDPSVKVNSLTDIDRAALEEGFKMVTAGKVDLDV